MIRILLICSLILLSVNPVFAEDLQGNVQEFSKIKAPEFSEFALVRYESRKANNETLTAMEKALGKIFYISVIGIPIAIPMSSHAELREKNNYWADRKQNFETSLKYCQAYDNVPEIKRCYKELRRTELYKNSDKKIGTMKGTF